MFAAAFMFLSGCTLVGHTGDDAGAVAFDSEGGVSRWCLPADQGETEIEFSHGNEILVNSGQDTAQVVGVSLIGASGIEVKDFWFAEVRSPTVGTLRGWPPKASKTLVEPYPLEPGDAANLVVHLTAAVMDSARPPTATGLQVTYLQGGDEHVAQTRVGVRLRQRC